MKTMIIELRYTSGPGRIEPMAGLVDGINDELGEIAQRFGLDVRSISHVVETYIAGDRGITCTAVCLLNGETIDHIGKELEREDHKPGANWYCFAEAFKLSVRVNEIRYN